MVSSGQSYAKKYPKGSPENPYSEASKRFRTEADNLQPIKDVAGRDYKNPIGSPQADRQHQEAIEIVKAQGLYALSPANVQQQALKLQQQNEQQLRIQKTIRARQGTITKDYSVQTPPVSAQPYIKQEIVDYERDTTTGRKIPIIKTSVVDPYGEDIGGGGFRSTEREATTEEREYFKQQTGQNDLVISSQQPGVIRTSGIYDMFHNALNKVTSTDIATGQGLRNALDFSAEQGQAQLQSIQESTDYLKEVARQKIKNEYLQKVAVFGAEAGGQVAGAFGYIGESTLESPIISTGKRVALGVAIGFGASALVGGAGYVGGAVGTATAKTGLSVLGGGLTAVYGAKQISKYATAPSTIERGAVLGETALDVSLVGSGALLGQKGYQSFAGYLKTLGRTFIPPEKLIPSEVLSGEKLFPTAPKSQQLYLFEKTTAGKLPGTSLGGFHTSNSKFWGDYLTAQPGSSELPGIYVSSYVSKYFAKISGSSSNIKAFGLVSGAESPGVAYLQPKGFRISPYAKVKPYKIGDQTFNYAFTKPTDPGYLDIPLMKTEIEAIARPGETYLLTSSKFYTKIDGVRVPIDIFSYSGEGAVTSGGAKIFSPSSYSYGSSASLINPLTIGSSSIYGNSDISSITNSVSLSSLSSLNSPSYSYAPSSSAKSYSKVSGSYSPKSSSSKSLLSSTSSAKSKPSYSPSSTSLTSYKRTSYSPFVPEYTPKQRYSPPYRPKYRRQGGLFGVQVRRFGKFRSKGMFTSLRQATATGKFITGSTLGASFKVTGQGALNLRTPKGYYKSKKEPGVFIEKRGRRLKKRKTGSKEIPEIQLFRSLKSKKKKKKKGLGLFY